MVWGMALPSGFGAFFPEGTFEGWARDLTTYYARQSAADRKALFDSAEGSGGYCYYVAQKFKNELGTCIRQGDPPFTPVRPNEAPASFLTKKHHAELGALIKLESMILAVDERLKDLIEQIEPGLHGLFPLEIHMPKGQVYPVRYYTLVIGRYLDSFLPTSSRQGSWRPNGPDKYFPGETKKDIGGLAFSRPVFGNAHLWRERRLGTQLTCFSDELQAAIATANLRIPQHYRMIEV